MIEKFKFTTDYQWDLLRYIVLDEHGERAIKKIKDTYFTLIEHQIIAYALLSLYKSNRSIPGSTLLKEKIRSLLNSKNYHNLVTKNEQEGIMNLVNELYKGILKDGDAIYDLLKEFTSYIEVKTLIEEFDLNDQANYKPFINKLQIATSDQDELDNSRTSLLFSNVRERQLRRKEKQVVVPTPIRQLNNITSAGGYDIGSIIVLLDKQKQGKTAVLVNIAKGYVKMRKPVLYIDLENGKDAITIRFEQSIMNLTKPEVLNGEHDDRIQKKLRKYKRVGGEVVIERLPALTTNSNHIQDIIDFYYKNYGIRFKVLVIDFMGKLGAINMKGDETQDISRAYIDIANLVERNGIEHCWTAHHVTREAAKLRMKTRYESTDTAKSIDINRHVHAIYGLNRTPDEEAEGIIRMELVEHRDGSPTGRAIFTSDLNRQTVNEINANARKEYDEVFYPMIFKDSEKDVNPRNVNKRPRRTDA